jgi:hypothetical protein
MIFTFFSYSFGYSCLELQRTPKADPLQSEIPDEVVDTQEEILSESLLLELGGSGTGDVIQTSSRKKKKDKSGEVTAEIIEAAKKISKSEKKRVEQIRIRKEKEDKRDQYLKLLNEHVMSDSHRQLLTSSQNIGQTATLKGALKKALKRHQAGLSITAEEQELLFPHNKQQVISNTAVQVLLLSIEQK